MKRAIMYNKFFNRIENKNNYEIPSSTNETTVNSISNNNSNTYIIRRGNNDSDGGNNKDQDSKILPSFNFSIFGLFNFKHPLLLLMSKIGILRISVIFCLIFTAISVGYGSFRLLSDFEAKNQKDQYYSLARQIELIALNAVNQQVDALNMISSVEMFRFSNISEWPYVALPVNFYDEISHPLLELAGMRSISTAVLIHSTQVAKFENFAYKYFADEGHLDLGVSSFGNGIYAIDSSGQRYHNSLPHNQTKYPLLAPVISIVDVKNNGKVIMYNTYSERKRATAIDYVLNCSTHNIIIASKKSNCTAISDIISLVQDPTYRPASLIVYPIQFPNATFPVGIMTSVFNWDAIFSHTASEIMHGIDIILNVNGLQYSFHYRNGLCEYIGLGDLHDGEFDSQQYEFVATTAMGSMKYVVTIYPNREWMTKYQTNIPYAVMAVAVGMLVVTSFIFFLYDYSAERKSREMDLILNTKRQFVRFISHEIRTPLNTVNIGIQTLSKELLKSIEATSRLTSDDNAIVATESSNDNLKKWMIMCPQLLNDWFILISEIKESTDASIEVLNDLINYDKLNTGSLNLETGCVNIWKIIRKSAQLFLMQSKVADIELVMNLQIDKLLDKEEILSTDDLVLLRKLKTLCVIGDAIKLDHVIRNLISNALKFTPAKGVVRITAEYVPNEELAIKYAIAQLSHKSTGYIAISVIDSGVGLTKDQIDKLFQPGVQFNANTLQAGGGSGLGLWIAHGIVKLHHGAMVATSDGEHRGCNFQVILPATMDYPENTREAASQISGISKSIKSKPIPIQTADKKINANSVAPSSNINKILVVDDSRLNRKMLCRYLESSGYACLEAVDGEDCINIICENISQAIDSPIQLILMDYEMPRMNGPTATLTLRDRGINIPIVGITGNVLMEDRAAFLKAGALSVLNKPITLEDLQNLINNIDYNRIQII